MPRTTDVRIRLAILFGGRSPEHAISLRSAASVLRHLDGRYAIELVSIDEQGTFRAQPLPASRDVASLAIDPSAPRVHLRDHPGTPKSEPTFVGERSFSVDAVFPVVHGPGCEDGSLQGLLETADVPYVGSRVLGSAIGMDKDVAKRLAREGGVEPTPFLTLRRSEWTFAESACEHLVESSLGFPVFVKPANMGSSIGVTRVADRRVLREAMALAFELDDKAMVEAAIDAREIEIAVLGPWGPSGDVETSVPGEIVPRDRFYSYDRKYLDPAGADFLVPAPLSEEESDRLRMLARRVFGLLECEGMARVDFFLDRKSGRFYFSEINTLPGFTDISMFPKLWEATDLPFGELLERLIDDAIARHASRARLRRTRE